ncbi:MAG: hypothetical protein Q4B28_01440 [bacterium]|nr:hypothetical protein [bacterium]
MVEPNICKIAKEHSIIAEYCSESIKNDTSIKLIPSPNSTTPSKKSGMPTAIKVLLWIVGIVVVSFIGIIIAFAIKAKLREKYEEEE